MDMSKRFNASDWTGTYIFDRKLGVGLEYKNPENFVKASTLVSEAIKTVKKQNGYAEQMRLLYVALTRAEQKLFLVGSMESKDKAFDLWNKGNSRIDHLLSARLRLQTNNFMDWIGLAIARHQLVENEVSSLQKNKQIKNYPVQFSCHFYSDEHIMEELQELNVNEEPAWVSELTDNKMKLSINKETEHVIDKEMSIIEHDYPYQLSTITTNYQSVSEVKQLFEEPNNEKLAKIDWTDESRINRYTTNLLERPKFLQEETSPKPAEIGQATHFLLQNIDLSQKITKESLEVAIQQMVEEGVMREEVAHGIDIEKIDQYFQTSFGQENIKYQAELVNEVFFYLMMEARDVFTGMETVADPILIHGIIDGYFKRSNGLVLFDYK